MEFICLSFHEYFVIDTLYFSLILVHPERMKIEGEHGTAARGEQLRQPEGAPDGLAQARARALQGHRA